VKNSKGNGGPDDRHGGRVCFVCEMLTFRAGDIGDSEMPLFMQDADLAREKGVSVGGIFNLILVFESKVEL